MRYNYENIAEATGHIQEIDILDLYVVEVDDEAKSVTVHVRAKNGEILHDGESIVSATFYPQVVDLKFITHAGESVIVKWENK